MYNCLCILKSKIVGTLLNLPLFRYPGTIQFGGLHGHVLLRVQSYPTKYNCLGTLLQSYPTKYTCLGTLLQSYRTKYNCLGTLVLSILGAFLGMFYFGYNSGVMSAPENSIKQFIVDSHKERCSCVKPVMWIRILDRPTLDVDPDPDPT